MYNYLLPDHQVIRVTLLADGKPCKPCSSLNEQLSINFIALGVMIAATLLFLKSIILIYQSVFSDIVNGFVAVFGALQLVVAMLVVWLSKEGSLAYRFVVALKQKHPDHIVQTSWQQIAWERAREFNGAFVSLDFFCGIYAVGALVSLFGCGFMNAMVSSFEGQFFVFSMVSIFTMVSLSLVLNWRAWRFLLLLQNEKKCQKLEDTYGKLQIKIHFVDDGSEMIFNLKK